MRLVHPFSFLNAQRDANREARLFQLRDVTAQLEILGALQIHGYGYGEPLLNMPPRASQTEPSRGRVDVSAARPGDLILTTTRPPLSDTEQGPRKKIRRGHTDLEEILFGTWRRFADPISRDRVALAPALRPALRPGYESRKDMAFRECEGAWYKDVNALDGSGWRRFDGELRTAAFLLRVEELWPEGPGLLGVFGMDGVTSLVFAYLLRHAYAELLLEPGFVMVELVGSRLPQRPTDLRWALDWKFELALRHRL